LLKYILCVSFVSVISASPLQAQADERAQICLDVILQSRIYTKSNDIINGRQWINEKHYSGSPLLISDYWPTGDIYYNGLHYYGEVLNYDLFKQEMIIYRREQGKIKFVVISNEKLGGFAFTDTVSNRKHVYEFRELPGTPGKVLYENASAGGILFYIKPIKKIELRSTTEGSGDYADYFEYYLNSGDGFTKITSKRQLVKLLPGDGPALKRYMHDHGFKMSDRNPQMLIDLVRYCSSLN
jgi:hypothetical protein